MHRLREHKPSSQPWALSPSHWELLAVFLGESLLTIFIIRFTLSILPTPFLLIDLPCALQTPYLPPLYPSLPLFLSPNEARSSRGCLMLFFFFHSELWEREGKKMNLYQPIIAVRKPRTQCGKLPPAFYKSLPWSLTMLPLNQGCSVSLSSPIHICQRGCMCLLSSPTRYVETWYIYRL